MEAQDAYIALMDRLPTSLDKGIVDELPSIKHHLVGLNNMMFNGVKMTVAPTVHRGSGKAAVKASLKKLGRWCDLSFEGSKERYTTDKHNKYTTLGRKWLTVASQCLDLRKLWQSPCSLAAPRTNLLELHTWAKQHLGDRLPNFDVMHGQYIELRRRVVKHGMIGPTNKSRHA